VSLERWEFVIDDGTNVLRRWEWKSFRDLRCDGRGQPEAEDGATGKGRSGESDQPDATSLEE